MDVDGKKVKLSIWVSFMTHFIIYVLNPFILLCRILQDKNASGQLPRHTTAAHTVSFWCMMSPTASHSMHYRNGTVNWRHTLALRS